MDGPLVKNRFFNPIRNIFVAIRKRLSSNLTSFTIFTIFSITFILIGLAALFLHAFVSRRVDQVFKASLVSIAASYEDAMHYPLMVNDINLLQEIVSDIGNRNQAKSVRLLNQDGVIVASSVQDETGIRMDKDDTRCMMCHSQGESQVPISEFQSLTNSDERVLLVSNPVDNQISCQGCHDKEHQTLGLIFVEFPSGQIEDWHTIFDIGLLSGSLGLATLISWGIYSLMSAHVIQPIKLLAHFSESDPSGTGENEISQISKHLKHMQDKLEIKDQAFAEEHRKIDYLLSLQFNTENPPSLEKFFRQGIEIIQEITGFSTIALYLYEAYTETFRLMAQRGMPPEMPENLRDIPASIGLHAEMIQTYTPVFTSGATQESISSKNPGFTSAGYRSMACIPLLFQGELVGSMQLASKDGYIWSENDRRWLGLIGRRIGLLIHQIQLSERLKNMAVMDERARIAQEIHDGLSQLVGALRIWTEEAMACLQDRELDNVQETLEKIEIAASDAYASLREDILGLRDNMLPNKKLSIFLAEYLRRFQRQWGIHTELQMAPGAKDLDYLPITQAARIQLIRIFQEGLTNVRRHAKATWIIVAVACIDGWLILHIKDDGIGFDLQNVPDDRFGLRIMRERAATAGGAVEISSQIGQGTQLEIKMPLRVLQDPETSKS